MSITIKGGESGAIHGASLNVQRHYDYRDDVCMKALAEKEVVSGWSYSEDQEQGGRAVPIMDSADASTGAMRVGPDRTPERRLERPWDWNLTAYSGWWRAGR